MTVETKKIQQAKEQVSEQVIALASGYCALASQARALEELLGARL
jgi:hypothetical protein